MHIGVALSQAWKALRRNKLRSALSVLGICIGIAAVVCTVAIGTAGAIEIRRQLANLGENLVWVEAGGRNLQGVRTGSQQTKTLVLDDLNAILREIPQIRSASPQVDGRVQIIRGERNWNTSVRGVTPAFFEIRHWLFASGEPFRWDDVDRAENVCAIGSTIAEKLFGNEDPVGQTMRVSHLVCEIRGVLQSKGPSPNGGDYDDTIFMPYTTVQQKITGVRWFNDIACSAVSQDMIAEAEQRVVALMRQRHHVGPDDQPDFNIRHPEDVVQAQASATQTYMFWMGCVAAISLLVGSVGIMNIMLVSTTERTREIGVRMAIGASASSIKLQFLSEAVLLGALGGLSGVLTGVIGSVLLSHFTEWHAQVSLDAVVIGSVLSIAVGVLSGYYPASRASSLDPIEALRHE